MHHQNNEYVLFLLMTASGARKSIEASFPMHNDVAKILIQRH